MRGTVTSVPYGCQPQRAPSPVEHMCPLSMVQCYISFSLFDVTQHSCVFISPQSVNYFANFIILHNILIGSDCFVPKVRQRHDHFILSLSVGEVVFSSRSICGAGGESMPCSGVLEQGRGVLTRGLILGVSHPYRPPCRPTLSDHQSWASGCTCCPSPLCQGVSVGFIQLDGGADGQQNKMPRAHCLQNH